MHVFVVTGRAGDSLWPAKVFSDGNEMPAKLFCDITRDIGNACRDNLKLFRASELWAKMNIAERAACEAILTGPIDAMDKNAVTAELDDPLVYTYQRVALHD